MRAACLRHRLPGSGQDKPLTSGAYAGPQDIITKAGGDHIMKDLKGNWTTVGWETVVARAPGDRDQRLRRHVRRAEAGVPHVLPGNSRAV